MEPFPHHYRVAARTGIDTKVTLTSEGLASFESTPPVEFDGDGTDWSPETLFVAAVADCYALSLKAVARASKLDWKALHCEAVGTLEQVDKVTQFTRIALQVELTVGSDTDESRAERVLRKAEEICLVTNSLTSEVTLDVTVKAG